MKVELTTEELHELMKQLADRAVANKSHLQLVTTP